MYSKVISSYRREKLECSDQAEHKAAYDMQDNRQRLSNRSWIRRHYSELSGKLGNAKQATESRDEREYEYERQKHPFSLAEESHFLNASICWI